LDAPAPWQPLLKEHLVRMSGNTLAANLAFAVEQSTDPPPLLLLLLLLLPVLSFEQAAASNIQAAKMMAARFVFFMYLLLYEISVFKITKWQGFLLYGSWYPAC
jgi:uncharacterized membrane protein